MDDQGLAALNGTHLTTQAQQLRRLLCIRPVTLVSGEVLRILRRCAGQEYRRACDEPEAPVRLDKIDKCLPKVPRGDMGPIRIRTVKTQSSDVLAVRGGISERN